MSPDEVALRSFPELHWDEGVNLDGSRVVIHIQNRIKKQNIYIWQSLHMLQMQLANRLPKFSRVSSTLLQYFRSHP